MYKDFLPQTPIQYMASFRQLAAIIEDAVDNIELHSPTHVEQLSLESLAHAIDTLAGLRGDTAIYEGSRPDGLEEFQREMYATENNLRQRLLKLGYEYPHSTQV